MHAPDFGPFAPLVEHYAHGIGATCRVELRVFLILSIAYKKIDTNKNTDLYYNHINIIQASNQMKHENENTSLQRN